MAVAMSGPLPLGACTVGAAPVGAAPTVQAPSGRGPDMATAIDERGGAAHSRWGAVARFFSGQTHYDFIGRSRLWLGVVLASIVVSILGVLIGCLLYTSPSPRDGLLSRMPSSACNKKTLT